jgi:hypothetical protein
VDGALRAVKKSWAREAEVEDAAATTWWRTSWTERVLGSMRRSLVNCLAIPPVAGWVLVGMVGGGEGDRT